MSGEQAAVDRDVEAAVGFILRSTRQRPQTEAELAAKLHQRDVPESIARAAVARARELGAVDDAAFARAWVEDRGRERGYGVARVRQELLRRQVPDHVVDAAIAALEDRDEEAAATELAQHRFSRLPATLEPEKAAVRLVGFLQRRGYPQGLARRVALRVSGLDRPWD